MIFFIVPKRATDYSPVKRPVAERPSWAELHHRGNSKLIAWNEVPGWADPFAFLADLLAAASGDEVCQWMRRTSMKHGLEPFTEQGKIPESQFGNKPSSVGALLAKLICHWCDPAVGNLPKSPNPRPSSAKAQFFAWKEWQVKNQYVLERATLQAIALIFIELPTWRQDDVNDEDQRARRDQVKLFHNITEAARAFIGEVTTFVAKKVEKLFAFRLCRSERLLAAQRELLTGYVSARPWKTLLELMLRDLKYFEYVRFFLEDHLPPKLSPEEQIEFTQALLATATNPEFDTEALRKTSTWSALQAWLAFPPTIRCAMLINLLRKLDDAMQPHPHRTPFKHRARMTIGTLPALGPNPHAKLPAYQSVVGAAEITHVPEDFPLARAWNRDEYDITEITYRIYGCPIWAGNSGHTAEALYHYINVLEDRAPGHTAQTIVASLFMFWRLYYDRRITPVHTMVDTFEATWNHGVGGAKATPSSLEAPVNAINDVWGFIQASSFGQPNQVFAVDPIDLMSNLTAYICAGKPWSIAAVLLDDQLERERAWLDVNRYAFPRYSRGIDFKIAQSTMLKPRL